MVELFWLLLPVAACSGWLAGNKNKKIVPNLSQVFSKETNFNQKYIEGLNLILNEQPDKAVDVFIDLFSVDNDTVETHLALGSLFRRRGEVERAIRIHQNVIARPSLCREQRIHGMLELGSDYLVAGVLDRAENIFNDILKQEPNQLTALLHLLDIYQRQQDWQAAINVALLLQKQKDNRLKYNKNIAHYYCELTILSKMRGNLHEALFFNHQALKYQTSNVRANLILADLYICDQQINKGIEIYYETAQAHNDYLDIILPLLIKVYREQALPVNDLLMVIENLIIQVPRVLSIKEVINFLLEYKEHQAIIEVISHIIPKVPSLRIMENLLELIAGTQCTNSQNYDIFRKSVQELISRQKSYNCNNCGFNCSELLWLCPSCKSWDTIQHDDFTD